MNRLETKVKQTLAKMKISKKDKILVALSGGKDSTVVAYLLHKLGYKIEGVHIDLKIGKYSEECLKKVVDLAEALNMPLHLFDMKKEMGSGMCYLRTAIQSEHSRKNKGTIKNCAICGVIKKWILNKVVRGLSANYIATGHNLDDEAQTFLMNILKGSPKLSANTGIVSKKIKGSKFIPRIKPLYYVAEEDVKIYSKKMKLPVHYEGCPCAIDSYRIQVRSFLENVDTKKKENIIKNFEIFKKGLKEEVTNLQYCELCGEPSRGKVCKKCKLMSVC